MHAREFSQPSIGDISPLELKRLSLNIVDNRTCAHVQLTWAKESNANKRKLESAEAATVNNCFRSHTCGTVPRLTARRKAWPGANDPDTGTPMTVELFPLSGDDLRFQG